MIIFCTEILRKGMNRDMKTDQLHIQMFGHFKLTGMGGTLDEDAIRSDMLTKLLTYICSHRKKEITTQELVETLWYNEESENPTGALKNLVYRLRTMLKKEWPEFEFVLTGRGAYKWNADIPVVIDIEEFERHCEAAAAVEDLEEKLNHYKEAIKLYRGMFLPKFSGEYWVTSLSTYYHSIYLSAVKATVAIYEQQGKYEEMGQMCNYALQLDNLDEYLHCYFIMALIHQKKFKLAAEQYKKAVDNLYENLGVSPSEGLRRVYGELLKQTNEQAKSIDDIQKELTREENTGAFLCEYGVFREAYHLEKRRASRMGISVYLGLITVVPVLNVKEGSPIYLNIIRDGMEQLEKVLLHCLRSGDVISKFSGTQYIILLPTCQYETAKMVMNRIEEAYQLETKGKAKVKLRYSLDEMDFSF